MNLDVFVAKTPQLWQIPASRSDRCERVKRCQGGAAHYPAPVNADLLFFYVPVV